MVVSPSVRVRETQTEPRESFFASLFLALFALRRPPSRLLATLADGATELVPASAGKGSALDLAPIP